ncbi:MAG: hypothetical protein CMD50_00515 [Gammaproteobacteria bacterium]|nr:hypothetical protein [Gammaproteobacteria bacterium]|tara:strand:- start:288 stop:644 length:357 start_codon:yes stop_codon:yes gene_type:complete
MKKKLLPLLTIFFIYGCGYSSQSECQVKEMQECNSVWCEIEAQSYCANLFAEKEDRKDNFTEFLKVAGWMVFAMISFVSLFALKDALFKEEGPDLFGAFFLLCLIGSFIFFAYMEFFK